MDKNCPICFGVGWVCGNHPDRALDAELGCQCGAGIPCRCNDGDEMDAEAEKHIRPIEAMLAGKLPPAETFELNMPAGATQGMLLREVRRIQEALVAWIVETHRSYRSRVMPNISRRFRRRSPQVAPHGLSCPRAGAVSYWGDGRGLQLRRPYFMKKM